MKIRNEELSSKEIDDFFLKTVNDFPKFDDIGFRQAYVIKLATFASFISARTEEGTLVGMVAYYLNQKPLCYITHVSVLSQYKGQGIFSSMFCVLQHVALRENFHIIQLEVKTDNITAINAYNSKGFKTLGCKTDKSFLMEKRI